jgi:hypothetical protein
MPEQKLNPEALRPLYGLAKLCIRFLNRDDCPETTSRLRTAIALAESTPEPPPPSGAMTIEQAREITAALIRKSMMRTWAELANGVHEADIVSAILDTDRAARLETLESLKTFANNHSYFDYAARQEIERRLKEIKNEHTAIPRLSV